MKRLKTKEISEVRETMLNEQNGLCGLQNIPIEDGQAVLDHCHTEGHVRTVLSRNANAIEGRILSLIGRLKGKPEPIEFLKALIAYWEDDYSSNPIHPTHLLSEEKERKKLKKKLKKLKSKTHIDRTKVKIKELDSIIKQKLD